MMTKIGESATFYAKEYAPTVDVKTNFIVNKIRQFLEDQRKFQKQNTWTIPYNTWKTLESGYQSRQIAAPVINLHDEFLSNQ